MTSDKLKELNGKTQGVRLVRVACPGCTLSPREGHWCPSYRPAA